MRILTTIIFILFSILVKGQDTIYFTTYDNGEDFSIIVDTVNDYPRQDAIRFQETKFDSINSLYFQDINLVSEKALTTSDSSWTLYLRVLESDLYWHNNILYQCVKDHKTTLVNEPPNEKYWSVYVQESQIWIIDEDVVYGDIRSVDGIDYICIKAHKTKDLNKPPDTKYWELNP